MEIEAYEMDEADADMKLGVNFKSIFFGKFSKNFTKRDEKIF